MDMETRIILTSELISTPEATAILGISTQRMFELYRQGRMPEPVVKRRHGWIWCRHDITEFLGQWDRRSGIRRNQGKTGK